MPCFMLPSFTSQKISLYFKSRRSSGTAQFGLNGMTWHTPCTFGSRILDFSDVGSNCSIGFHLRFCRLMVLYCAPSDTSGSTRGSFSLSRRYL